MRLKIASALLLALPLIALAGPPGLRGGDGPPDPAERIERMTEHLGLDAAQQEAIRGVMDAAQEEGRQLHEQIKADLEAMKAAREAGDDKALKRALNDFETDRSAAHDLREDARSDIRAQLSLEQKALFAEGEAQRHQMEQHMRERVQQHRGERDGGERFRTGPEGDL